MENPAMKNENQIAVPDVWILDQSATPLSIDEITVGTLIECFGSEYAKGAVAELHFDPGRMAPLLDKQTPGWISSKDPQTVRNICSCG